MVCRDSRAQMSEMGLAPWYAGLVRGEAGRGERSVYFMAVKDSRA